MNNEQSGVPRPQQRQQMGLNDMQLWQQQLVYRQFQELQRQQQQLQQLDQQSRQQSSLNQLSGIAKQSTDQLSALINGAPVHDSSSYWTHEVGGGDSKIPSASQMHMVGNVNWIQRSGPPSMQSFPGGLMQPQDQTHALSSVGFTSQQYDQSIYGAPVTGTRGNLSQYSPFQGFSHDNTDISAKLASNQVEKKIVQPVPSNSFQIAQPSVFHDQHCPKDGASISKEGLNEKILFGRVPMPTLPNGTFAENFQQVNQFQRNAQAQEFLGRKDGDGWMGNLQEKANAQVPPPQGVVSLDPTEEKILFGSEDGIWGAFGRTSGMNERGYGQSNQFDNHLNAFPSTQSGSWSALMQSAVAETSSDTGPQDEWSGLNFQKPDLSTGSHPLPLDNNGKQPAPWVDKNLQTASSVVSRPFPLFDGANSNTGSRGISGFQQTNTEYAFEGAEKVRMNAFHESVLRLPEEVGKSPVEGSRQVQTSIHLEKTSEGAVDRQIHEQLHRTEDSKHMGLNAQVMQDSLVHKQNTSPYNPSCQSIHKQSAWNINEALSPNGHATIRASDIQNHVQNNDKKQTMLLEGNHGGGMWKAEGNFMDISFPSVVGRLDQAKSGSSPQVHSAITLQNSNTSNINQETNQQIRHDGKLDYGKYVNVDSSIKHDGNDDVRKFPHQTRKSLQAQESSSNNSYRGLVETETSDSKQETYSSAHPHSNQRFNTEGGTRENAWLHRHDSYDVVGNNHQSSGQGVSQAVMGGLGRMEQGYHGQSRLSDNPLLDKAADTAKLPDFLRDAKGEMEVPSKSLNPCHSEPIMSASFHGSGSPYTPNRTQPSQNMLELLNKVDQSRDGKYTTHLGSLEHKALQMPELVASPQSVTQQQSQSFAMQGFALQLAPPSERMPNINHALSLQKSSQITDVNATQFEETSQRERNQSSVGGQTGIEPGQSIHGNSFPTVTLGSYPNNQQQEQQFPNTSGPLDITAHGLLASHVRHACNSHDGAVDRSPQASLPGFYGRITSFNFPSSAGPIASAQSYSSNASHNQNPVMLDMSQQGDLPLKPPNIWPNIAAQQHLSGRPSNNVPSSFFQPNQPACTSLEGTSRASQKADSQGKSGNVPPEFVSSSVNAQQFPYREGQPVKDNYGQQMPHGIDLAPGTASESQCQDPMARKFSEATCSTTSSPAIHPDHQLSRGEDVREQLVIRPEHTSLSNKDTSDHDSEAFSHSLKPSDAQHRNYSLLHQMQAMKDAESDPTRMSVKRLKGADFGDAAQVQHFAYGGYGRTAQDPIDELNVAAQQPLFTRADSKMLCFSSGRNEDLNKNASFQPHVREKHSKDNETFGRTDSQSSSDHPGMTSVPSHRVNEHPQINPQMAPSWFEKYGAYKNGQILAIHDELDSSKRNAKATAHQFFFGNASESLSQSHSGIERSNNSNANQVDNILQTPGTTTVAKEQLSAPYSLPNVEEDPTTDGSKKRKIMELDPLWHREVSQRLQSISMAELDWAQASRRQVEKVEDDAEMFEDGMPMPYQRRRLILTSQLMQQLLRSIPAALLSANATLEHKSVIYFSAKLALEDACTGVDSQIHPSGSNMLSEKAKNSEMVGYQFLSKVVEDFIDQVKKLENDLLRFEKRPSILDIRVDCQDLERFAIINRFARFHGRSNAPDTAGSSSSSGATIHRTYPQRYVTAHPLPRNLPEGVFCLSL